MNLLERLISKYEKRIKRIDDNPDPTRLKSNRIGYELDLNQTKSQLEAWRQGKPLLPYFLSTTLAGALGSQTVSYERLMTQFPEEATKYVDASRRMGKPEYLCDLLILGVAAAMVGDAPPPSLVTAPIVPCHVQTYHLKAFAEHFGAPYFGLDTPLEYNDKNLRYLADRIGELVEFAEKKVPGLKYNRDKHLELLEVDRKWLYYARKDWELKKQVPYPLDSGSGFRQPYTRRPSGFGDPEKVLEYWRVFTEEIEARAAKGINREEKIRLLWVGGRPVYQNLTDLLDKKAVAVPAMMLPSSAYYGGKPSFLAAEAKMERKLSPFEQEAKEWLAQDVISSELGHGWVDELLWACKDLKCDGIVYYQLLGCLHIAPFAKLVADRAEKELGVSTLIMAGSEVDTAFLSPAEFESRLSEFIDIVLAQKGKK